MNTLTAIELRPRALAAVTARGNGRGVEIVCSGTAPIEAIDAENVRRAMGACGISDTRAVLLIPRGQALLRELELPEGAPEEIVSMVRFQVEREMPRPLDKIRYSYIETGRAGGKVRIQVAAVPRDVLEPAVAALEGAGIKVSGIYVSSFGLLCLRPDDGPVVLAAVAAGEMEILGADGGRLEFSRTASIPGGPAAAAVADEIDRTLLSCDTRAGRKVRKVVLAGEGVQADELARGLRERMAQEVVQVGPGGLETAAAAGLCVGLLRSASLPDILKPPSGVKKFHITRMHRMVAGALLGVAGIVLVFQLALAAKKSSLERKNLERDELKPRADEISLMSRRTALAHQWYRDRKDWVRIFDALCRSIRRETLWLSGATFEESGTIRLTGRAKDEKHVTDFTGALKETEQFRDFVIKIENRKHKTNDKSGYSEEFAVAVSPAAAAPKGKK